MYNIMGTHHRSTGGLSVIIIERLVMLWKEPQVSLSVCTLKKKPSQVLIGHCDW